MRYEARQDDGESECGTEPGGEHEQPDEPGGEGRDEADEDRVLRVREDNGRIQRGDRARHHLRGDPLERRDEFAENRADSEQDHRHRDSEAESLGHRLHEVVADIGSTAECGEGRVLSDPDEVDHRDDQVHQDHRQRRGDHRVTEEAESLGNLDLLGGPTPSLRVDHAPDGAGGDVSHCAEVADGDRAVAGELLHPRMREGGQGDHEDSE